MSKIIGIDCRLWNETGVGRYIKNLILNLERLDRENIYKLFILKKDEQEVRSLLLKPNFKIIATDIKWHSLEEQIKFPFILYKENLDLMHFTYFSFPIFYFKRYILTIHDLIIWNYSTGKASTLPIGIYLIKRFFYKLNLKIGSILAVKIIAVSNFTKTEILKYLTSNLSKITVIKEGVDDIFKNKKIDLIKDKYFLYVGNAYPHKNLNFLISEFVKFIKINPEYKLYLVGKNDYFYSILRKRSEDYKNIIFLDFVNDSKLMELYKKAKAVIAPSLTEGFGLPLLEAMSLGAIVIASQINVFLEIAKKNPFYFNPQKNGDLIKALEKVLSCNQLELKEKIRKGIIISKEFSWNKMAEETLTVYKKNYL